jgi:hypothetical protein
MTLRTVTVPVLMATLSAVALAQQPAPDTLRFGALARSVAGSGTSLERTTRLVHWVNDGFTWSATDYASRTPFEIVARREGNCAELAKVLRVLLDSADVRSRWVVEINVQPAPTPRRQETAARLVAQRGNRLSVFGLQHNDHVWLEVWDDVGQRWFPADPAYGVVGLDEWVAARLALADRPRPRVDAVVPIAADMRVPFVVLAKGSLGGDVEEDRSEYYLVERFSRLYDAKLETLPSWAAWRDAVRKLAPLARGAFAGTHNLHEDTARIRGAADTYERLAAEAAARQLTWR